MSIKKKKLSISDSLSDCNKGGKSAAPVDLAARIQTRQSMAMVRIITMLVLMPSAKVQSANLQHPFHRKLGIVYNR
jgi:hypothetical protein